MNNPTPANSHGSPNPTASQGTRIARFRQWLQDKRISYFAVPLIIMATLAEFVILVVGWNYQRAACVPQGLGFTFFGIGPIGATILAVELLKLPLAVWTASRWGWQKRFMLFIGLPLLCLLTFQLVKDMAVYEMEVAMTPATQALEKATAEDLKISQLNADLAEIEKKKSVRDQKHAELAARQVKTKTEIEEALKLNAETRQDAISLTEYQKKELADVESRQASIIKQFDADAAALNKSIADLRARRELEVPRAAKWIAEEARLENEFKQKMSEYSNQKAAYDQAKAQYDRANPFMRALMGRPVDPGVPPVRETNTVFKPAEIADLDAQIKAKEAELLAINNTRRERIAAVDADARRIREGFDQRSTNMRAETDRKREELLAAQAALTTQWAQETKQIDEEYETAAAAVAGIRAELDVAQKNAQQHYEAREEAIKKTQVHRIATTVEILRNLVMGQRPVSVTATAKTRGDMYTDQIAMVRVWVYPCLAFLVAFLPTLMIELAFSTIFKKEKQQQPRQHRFGLFGQGLNALHKRASNIKTIRAERMMREVKGQIAVRDNALTAVKAEAEKSLAEKDAQVQQAHSAIAVANAECQAQLKMKEAEYVAKLTATTDSLNKAITEKDALRDLQKSEVERQISMRQNAWSDRITQLRKELDDQRTAFETERTTLMQDQHNNLMAVTEDCKTQIAQSRRQIADAELAAVEKNAKLSLELKTAIATRDTAESQLKKQADSFSTQLAHAKETATRDMEKILRSEKLRFEKQQSEFEKTLRQQDEDADHRLKQREQELSAAFEARLLEEKNKTEQSANIRVADLERQIETRVREVQMRGNQELQQREETAQLRLKQREQQLLSQSELQVNDAQTQAEQQLRRRESELERKLEAQSRESNVRLQQELQQQELSFHAKLKQREQELTAKAAAREAELQNQLAADLRSHKEELERLTESRVQDGETRLAREAQQKEEAFQIKLRQQAQQLQSQFDTRTTELKAQWEQHLRDQKQEWDRTADSRARAVESRANAELQQKEKTFQSKLSQRDEQWQTKLDAVRAELQAQTEQESRRRETEANETHQRSLRDLEASLRQQMQQQAEEAQEKAKTREQDFFAQLSEQARAYQSAKAQWEKKAEEKTNATIERLKAQVLRLEKERDDAAHSASEGHRQVENLEQKLTEASAFLNSLKNGKSVATK